jgi:Flp pilus assembly pilin Flp
MSVLISGLKQLYDDERAAEVTELAIVLALVVAGAIVTIGLVGGKVQKGFTDTNAGLP